jgi:hypothetical protein
MQPGNEKKTLRYFINSIKNQYDGNNVGETHHLLSYKNNATTVLNIPYVNL